MSPTSDFTNILPLGAKLTHKSWSFGGDRIQKISRTDNRFKMVFRRFGSYSFSIFRVCLWFYQTTSTPWKWERN